MFNLTPLVRNLIIVNVVVFLLQQFLPVVITRTIEGQEIGLGLTQLISLWGINSPLFQPYQFVTPMIFQNRRERCQGQHIEENMTKASMGKHVGEKLVRLK